MFTQTIPLDGLEVVGFFLLVAQRQTQESRAPCSRAVLTPRGVAQGPPPSRGLLKFLSLFSFRFKVHGALDSLFSAGRACCTMDLYYDTGGQGGGNLSGNLAPMLRSSGPCPSAPCNFHALPLQSSDSVPGTGLQAPLISPGPGSWVPSALFYR